MTYREWMGAPASSDIVDPVGWKPPGAPEILFPATSAEHCIGEFSITWNRPLRMWLMLYNCPGGIEARVAPAPWGPMVGAGSAAEQGRGRRLSPGHDSGRLRKPPGLLAQPRTRPNGKFVAGGFYAPYVLDRYTSGADPSRRSTIYWLLSTWNPYEVTVMRTTFEHNSR